MPIASLDQVIAKICEYMMAANRGLDLALLETMVRGHFQERNLVLVTATWREAVDKVLVCDPHNVKRVILKTAK